MTETLQDDDRKRLRAAENLGWLAGSSTYSKKRKFIEGAAFILTSLASVLSTALKLLSDGFNAGVSGTSVVELKAELYRAQQDAKLAQEGLLDEDRKDRKKAGIDVSGILGRRNAGVEQRSAKDDLSYKVSSHYKNTCKPN